MILKIIIFNNENR